MIKSTTINFCVVIILISGCYTPLTVLAQSNYKGDTYKLDSILKNNEKVDVVIETANFAGDSFPYVDPVWWGVEFKPPKIIIRKIKIKLNQAERWVSFSAYSDLVNINSVDLIVFQDGFRIAIDGGGSSSHYIANLYFDNDGFLVSRKVYNPSFPDEVWEKTNYSFIRRSDM